MVSFAPSIFAVGLLSICASGVISNEIDVTRSGAVPNDRSDDRAAIQRAIASSKPGETVRFPPGVFDVKGTILLAAGRSYIGSADTVLRFELPEGEYGVAIVGDAEDLTFSGFTLIGGGIRLSDGERYKNIRIIHNSITQPAKTPGIYCSIPSDGLVIEHNRFHDYPHYGLIIYHMNAGSISRNVFHNIEQGAHILGPLNDCSFSFNHGTRLTRMGLEVQRMGNSIARNLVVAGNAFHDWKLPYRDSFGLSIVPDGSINTRIINNYIRADFTGEWHPETKRDGQGKRFGFGIEAGLASGVVQGNVVGGRWANHIVVSHRNTLVRDNKLYGKPVWKKHISGEPGPDGYGSAVSHNNLIESDFSKMPRPPSLEDVTAAADSAESEGTTR